MTRFIRKNGKLVNAKHQQPEPEPKPRTVVHQDAIGRLHEQFLGDPSSDLKSFISPNILVTQDDWTIPMISYNYPIDSNVKGDGYG